MPELPEVENVCQTLRKLVVGHRIKKVTIHRPDVITGLATPQSLLQGKTIAQVVRHGKQLAMLADNVDQAAVNIHLGMSGRLMGITNPKSTPKPHCHVQWHLANGERLDFIDPRRFGGLWIFGAYRDLRQSRWDKLGDDALQIRPDTLLKCLSRTRRPLKAALLDQNLVAGLGNIYVDELCFACKISPHQLACELNLQHCQLLVKQMRKLLKLSIKRGGSTLRDYVMVNGKSGQFQNLHKVYARAGKPCTACKTTLHGSILAGRTTVHCPTCQPPPETPEAPKVAPDFDDR